MTCSRTLLPTAITLTVALVASLGCQPGSQVLGQLRMADGDDIDPYIGQNCTLRQLAFWAIQRNNNFRNRVWVRNKPGDLGLLDSSFYINTYAESDPETLRLDGTAKLAWAERRWPNLDGVWSREFQPQNPDDPGSSAPVPDTAAWPDRFAAGVDLFGRYHEEIGQQPTRLSESMAAVMQDHILATLQHYKQCVGGTGDDCSGGHWEATVVNNLTFFPPGATAELQYWKKRALAIETSLVAVHAPEGVIGAFAWKGNGWENEWPRLIFKNLPAGALPANRLPPNLAQVKQYRDITGGRAFVDSTDRYFGTLVKDMGSMNFGANLDLVGHEDFAAGTKKSPPLTMLFQGDTYYLIRPELYAESTEIGNQTSSGATAQGNTVIVGQGIDDPPPPPPCSQTISGGHVRNYVRIDSVCRTPRDDADCRAYGQQALKLGGDNGCGVPRGCAAYSLVQSADARLDFNGTGSDLVQFPLIACYLRPELFSDADRIARPDLEEGGWFLVNELVAWNYDPGTEVRPPESRCGQVDEIL